MIDFQQVTKIYAPQTVLNNVSLRINAGERVGIVGPNGAGKTTIFGLITGDIAADAGTITTPNDMRIGYVRQMAVTPAGAETLLEFTQEAVPALKTIIEEIHRIEDALSTTQGDADAKRLKRLGALQTEYEALGGYDIRHRAEQALCGLGFPPATLQQPFRALSGGWKTRAELARALIAQPQILLLDEPSNYLDLPAIEWLQSYLRNFAGTLALISHDRYLLNTLTDVTIEVANGLTEKYKGNYDAYVRERALRYEQRIAARRNQDRKRDQVERFIERFRATSSKASQVQSRIKMLEKMETVDAPLDIVSRGRIRLRPPPHSGQEVMRLDGAGLTYDSERWVLRGVDLRIMKGEKIALVGYNGLGKTTLLKMLAGRLPLSEGRRHEGHKVVIGYQSQEFADTMPANRTLLDTLREAAPNLSDQERRSVLGGFGFSGPAVEKLVSMLSGGEKIRMAFARLLANPPNFLILDEPTTHLDIQARETLEQALHDYTGAICMVSHDVDFVRNVAHEMIAMTPPGITRFACGYDDYRAMLTKSQTAPDTLAGKRATNGAPAPAAGPRPPTPDRRELRRERARARQDIQERSRELKQEIRRAERQIEVFETEQRKLLEQLAGGEANLNFADINRRLAFIQGELANYTRRWEEAGIAQEALTAGDSGENAPPPPPATAS